MVILQSSFWSLFLDQRTAHIIFTFSSCRRAWRESLLPCAFGVMGGWPLLHGLDVSTNVFFFQERIADSFPQAHDDFQVVEVLWISQMGWTWTWENFPSAPRSWVGAYISMSANACVAVPWGGDWRWLMLGLWSYPWYFWDDHPCRQNHFIVR